MATNESRGPDPVASLTLAAVAAVALAASFFLPWWVMRTNAPQYGQRTLEVLVGPRGPVGDTFEVDTLGHYVGIAPMSSLAGFERAVAPWGVALVIALLVAVPFLQRRRARLLAVAPVLVLPVFFCADVAYWTQQSVDHRSPDAALELTVTRIETKLFGQYEVGQFKVRTSAGDGLRMVGLAGLIAVGLAFSRPLRPPGRGLRRRAAQVAMAGVALVAAGRSEAGEVRVRPGQSIQAALDAGADAVVLAPGVYREPLTIRRAAALRGEPGAVIDGGGAGTVVRIQAPGVALESLTIRGSGDSYDREDAAVRVEAPGARLSRVVIEDALFGVFALQADGCVVERSEISGKPLPVPRRGDGIRLWYSHGCRLIGNVVRDSRDVVIWYSSDTVVEDNLVRRSRYGLHYMYSDRNTFRRNRFEDDEVGAAIMYSRGITLEENAFSFSTGPAAYGLLVKDADDVFIRRNRFIANSGALFFDGVPQSRGGRAEVEGNLVARNDVGVTLQPSSRGLRFWDNAFLGNREQVVVQGTASGADGNAWASGGRGNYWSDAVVYDADGDGVSELPYRAESTYEALADRVPELAFFAGSPAADAVDAAARLFPIFAVRPRMEDPHPLVSPPLTDWTASRDVEARSAVLPLTSAGLLALAGAGAWLGRRVLG
ncbi:MAG TPA: nitrous oxide reductase family maturation protein NosD [Myxococcaceae bacterium]|nr:nitrous oxide reductase family maturation protein NosD [Myxococcaceae bacterium]